MGKTIIRINLSLKLSKVELGFSNIPILHNINYSSIIKNKKFSKNPMITIHS